MGWSPHSPTRIFEKFIQWSSGSQSHTQSLWSQGQVLPQGCTVGMPPTVEMAGRRYIPWTWVGVRSLCLPGCSFWVKSEVTWPPPAISATCQMLAHFSKCNRKESTSPKLYRVPSTTPQLLSEFTPVTSVQLSSVAQSCPTLCDPMNRSTPGLPVHHQLPEFPQTHVRRVGDAIQPSHPLLSPSPPAPNPSQHQGLFQWVNCSHEVAKALEFQLQHQSFQWTPRTDLL